MTTENGRFLPRIGIVSGRPFPSNETDTQQIVKNASAIARAGFHVELVIPRRSGRVMWTYTRRIQELFDFYSVPNHINVTQLLTFPSGMLAPPTKLAHGVVAPFYALAQHFDVVYTRDFIPAILCLGLGKRVVFESYRSWGNEAPIAVRALAPLFRHPRFLGLISHSTYAARSMIRAGFPEDRIVVIHNGYDKVDMEPVLTREQARKALALSAQKKLVVYTGNMQPNKGMESILDVAVRCPDVHFLLVGGLPKHISRLTAYLNRLGTKNVSFVGHRPVGEVPRYLYAADILIVPPTKRPLAKYGRTVLPMKLFTYLAAGRAILAPALPDSGELLEHNKNACLVAPDDPDGTATALHELIEDSVQIQKLAAGAANTAKDLTWDARAQRIKTWLLGRINWQDG